MTGVTGVLVSVPRFVGVPCQGSRVRILDLFCGAGGAGMGYNLAGFEVVGVDIAPQPNYPFEFHRGDALEFLLRYGDEYDAVHLSPPCQAHSALTKGNRGRGWSDDHRDWIADSRRLADGIGLPYVIENVQGAPVRRDLTLCGLQFGLRVFRHRYFELGGWSMDALAHPSHKGHRVAGWRHGVKYEGDMVAVYGDGGGKGSVADWQAAMGINWTTVKLELAEAIPPAYTEWIGAGLAEELRTEVAA